MISIVDISGQTFRNVVEEVQLRGVTRPLVEWLSSLSA